MVYILPYTVDSIRQITGKYFLGKDQIHIPRLIALHGRHYNACNVTENL